MKTLRLLANIVATRREANLPQGVNASATTMPSDERLLSKLYRYLFPGWPLREPQGDLFLRQSLRRANLKALSRWLPHYARVHGVLTGLLGLLVWALGERFGGVCLALVGLLFLAEVMYTLTLSCALLAFVLSPHIGNLLDD